MRAVGISHGRYRFESVRNDLAKKDVIVGLAWIISWLISDFGIAGLLGFKGSHDFIHDCRDPSRLCTSCNGIEALVHNVHSTDLGHSDAFVGNGYAEVFWLPYLWGIEPAEYADFLNLCNLASTLERQWTADAHTRGFTDPRLTAIEMRLASAQWRWAQGTFESYVRQEAQSRLGGKEPLLTEAVALAIRNTWDLVGQALKARVSKIRAGDAKTAQEQNEALGALDPREAVRRAVARLSVA